MIKLKNMTFDFRHEVNEHDQRLTLSNNMIGCKIMGLAEYLLVSINIRRDMVMCDDHGFQIRLFSVNYSHFKITISIKSCSTIR